MKFVKFGYGRCTDHASKDIKSGRISRDDGVKLVKKYDHVVSSDLEHWLKYVNLKKKLFGKLQTHLEILEFGGSKKENGTRITYGNFSSYGKVHLSNKQIII